MVPRPPGRHTRKCSLPVDGGTTTAARPTNPPAYPDLEAFLPRFWRVPPVLVICLALKLLWNHGIADRRGGQAAGAERLRQPIIGATRRGDARIVLSRAL